MQLRSVPKVSNESWILLFVFFVYVALVFVDIDRHEPWFDEAQAWLLAREASFSDLFSHYMRYEGSPALWHFLLMLWAKNGFPYSILGFFAGTLASLGTAIFLRYSPFPILVKVLFPFTYFLFYQYAVVARSYVLLPTFLFLTAAIFPVRKTRFLTYISMLALLSQLSVHGLIIAMCLALLEIRDHWKHRFHINRPSLYKLIFGYGVLLTLGLLAVWQLRLPHDHSFVSPRSSYDWKAIVRTGQKFWVNALTESSNASGLIFVLSLWHFYKTKVLCLFLLPLLAMSHLFSLAYANVWHEGILFLLWVFTLWVSLTPDEELEWEPFEKDRTARRGYLLTTLCLLIVCCFQIKWSIVAYRNDYRETYSAAKDVATYIKKNRMDKKIIYATSFHSIAILPYFNHNIFTNYGNHKPISFWDWSSQNDMIIDLDQILLHQPDIIIIGIKSGFQEQVPYLPGYNFREFAGSLFWKNRVLEDDSYVLYEKINFSKAMKNRL